METHDYGADFDEWLEVIAEEGDMQVEDLASMIYSMSVYLRVVLTFSELRGLFIHTITKAEEALQRGKAVLGTVPGQTLNVLLAEERRALGISELDLPDFVPKEWE